MRAALLLLMLIASFMLAVCIPVPPTEVGETPGLPDGSKKRPPPSDNSSQPTKKFLKNGKERIVTFISDKSGTPTSQADITVFDDTDITKMGFSGRINRFFTSATNTCKGSWRPVGEKKWVYFKITGDGCDPSCFGWSAIGPQYRTNPAEGGPAAVPHGTKTQRYFSLSKGDPAHDAFDPSTLPESDLSFQPSTETARAATMTTLLEEFDREFMNPHNEPHTPPPATPGPGNPGHPHDVMGIPNILNSPLPPTPPSRPGAPPPRDAPFPPPAQHHH